MSKGRAEHLLRSFYRISGMEISLCDRNFHGLASHRHSGENFCSLIHRSSACLDLCHASDKEWHTRVKQIGAPVRYVCPFGMTEAILPILSGERAEGHIFCAMGICTQGITEEEILQRVLKVAPALPPTPLMAAICAMPHFDEATMNAYFEMLQLMADTMGKNDPVFERTPTLGELAKRYIRENLSHKITLTDLAWHLHCSTVTLTQHFRAEFGISVMEYVLQKRMQLAEQLLKSTEKPLSELATLCGFSDVEYFSRTFKKTYGLPPGKWRRGLQ